MRPSRSLPAVFFRIVGLVIPMGMVMPVQAVSLYWDGASTGPDADGGAGTWSTGPAANWDTAATAGDQAPWTNGSDAVFGGTGGVVTVSGTVSAASLTFDAPSYSLTGGTVALAGAAVIGTGANDVTLAPVISGTTISKTGTGTLTMAGSNTFTGGFTISEGTVKAGSSNALGDMAGVTTISPGATLDVNGQDFGRKQFFVSGTGVGGAGAIVNTGAAALNAIESLTMAGATTLGGTGNWNLVPGFSLAMGGFTLTKVGANEIGLKALVNTPGHIDVKEGTFSFLSNNIGGSAANTVTVRTGATLGMTESSTSRAWKAILEAGTTWRGSPAAGYDAKWSGPVSIAGATTFDVPGINKPMVHSGIISGSGSVTKTGAGIWTISGANTYTGGTTVTGGTLQVTSSSALGSGPVVVAAGGTLSGNSSIPGAVTIAGAIDPGVSYQAGILTLGPTILSGTYRCTIGSSDKLVVNGDLDLTGATLDVSIGPGSYSGAQVILSYTGTVTGSFSAPGVTANGLVLQHDVANKRFIVRPKVYEEWIASFPGLVDPSQDGDPDGDGLPNLVEYMLGGNPASFESQIRPKMSYSGGQLVLSFSRSTFSVIDTTQIVQWSQDLVHWNDLPIFNDPGTGETFEFNPGAEKITMSFPGDLGRFYVRLKVTKP
ncbi:autotransporter-associated beta strand repeat-containing protein [Luteolibacter soli]|uniref:Autotransporter-associated beta strand repeat-containing protein n=1 Tax=Luteolibacter soli TaxID=3135280 RepID=A0ABU9AVJ5_9BACT